MRFQVEKDGRMSALRSSLRPYEAAEEMAAAAAAGGPAAAGGAVERGAGMMGDGFSVEDLLDLEELCEVDRDGGEQGEAAAAAAAAVEKERSSDSHGSSVVSYEPMPLLPPVMDLPVRTYMTTLRLAPRFAPSASTFAVSTHVVVCS